MNYTPEMEKAMHGSHGVSYAEYGRKLDTRLHIEQKRDAEYERCKRMVAEIDSHIHK